LIPVFHTALYSRSRRDLGFILAGVALFYLLPILIVGAPAYPQTQYRAALLTVTVSSIIGLATQRLVAGVRHQAREARSHERMLEQVNEVVHGLFDSPEVRVAVCEAARTTSQASVALLYERARDSDTLRCTTFAGEEFGLLLLDCDPGSAEEVTERLRRHVPRGRTCSAGIAHRRSGETPEQVTVRADQALYQAKAAGRRRSQLSIENQPLRAEPVRFSGDAVG
jgi:diguanylate cyclase with GGDEF domain